MDSRELRRIVVDQREDLARVLSDPTLISRESQAHWSRWVDTDQIKVITGVRRCGKSVFSSQLLRGKDCAYLDFDDERLVSLPTSELDSAVRALYQVYGGFRYLFLDEVQNIERWELFASRLRRGGINIVLTGSNGRLLSQELGTRLTGRHIPIGLLPFSFGELLRFERIGLPRLENLTSRQRAQVLDRLEFYLQNGGFPEMLRDPARVRPYLQNLYSTIVTKDVLARYSIRHSRTLREIASYLVSNFAQPASYTMIKNLFGLKSVHTAKNYVGYLEDAYLVLLVDRYHSKHKEVLSSAKKVYCIDNGLATAVGYRISENWGRLLENLVAVELFRRKALEPLREVYYWKDHQQREVDFVVKEGPRVRELVQVTFASDERSIPAREIDSLVRAGAELGVRRLTLVTWDYEGTMRRGTAVVEAVPAWKWFLS